MKTEQNHEWARQWWKAHKGINQCWALLDYRPPTMPKRLIALKAHIKAQFIANEITMETPVYLEIEEAINTYDEEALPYHQWKFIQSASGNESWHECAVCGVDAEGATTHCAGKPRARTKMPAKAPLTPKQGNPPSRDVREAGDPYALIEKLTLQSRELRAQRDELADALEECKEFWDNGTAVHSGSDVAFRCLFALAGTRGSNIHPPRVSEAP